MFLGYNTEVKLFSNFPIIKTPFNYCCLLTERTCFVNLAAVLTLIVGGEK